MTTIAYTEVTTTTPRTTQVLAKLDRQRPMGDPLVDGATRLLSIPLREVYALLWRAGFITIN